MVLKTTVASHMQCVLCYNSTCNVVVACGRIINVSQFAPCESGSITHYHLRGASWLSFLVDCMKTNELTVFGTGDLSVRALYDREYNQHWFVLSDILDKLGTSTWPFQAVETIKEGLCNTEDTTPCWEISPYDISNFVKEIPIEDSSGRKQKATIVSEPAATFLVSRSNTEAGKRLNRFIHVEVLPQIHQTGYYAPSKRKQFVLEHKQTCLDGLRALLELTHTERVGVIRELLKEQVFGISQLLSRQINDDLRYFSEREAAKRGHYMSPEYFREHLALAGLVDEFGYFTDEGREYGRVNETGDAEWRLDVLDYIKNDFVIFKRRLA